MDSNFWQQRTLARRRLLASAGLVSMGTAAAIMAGCGSSNNNSGTTKAPASGNTAPTNTGPGSAATASAARSTAAAAAPSAAGGAQPRAGGTFLTGNVTFPDSTRANQDPHSFYGSITDYCQPTQAMLVYQNQSDDDPANWKLQPNLATGWETPDSTTITFKLLPNARFQNLAPVNGRVMTADDVRYSIERIKNTKAPTFTRFNDFKGVNVEVVDPTTARFKFDQPMAAFWTRLTTAGTFIMAKEVIDADGGIITGNKPVAGLGPFINDSWDHQGTFRVKKNPDYFKAGKPYPDAVEARYFADTEAAFVAFKAGQTDLNNISGQGQWDEARKLSDTVTRSRPGIVPNFTTFNTNKPPFNDPRVRYAVSLATPRQDMVKLAYQSTDFATVAGPGGLDFRIHGNATYKMDDLLKHPGYRSGADADKDLADAKQMLQAAGFTGYKGNFYVPNVPPSVQGTTIAETLVENYKKLGLDLTITPKSYADMLALLPGQDWDIANITQGGTFDPDGYLVVYFATGGDRNYSKWSNPDFDKLLAQEQVELDANKRNAIIKQMVDLLEKQAPRMASIVPTATFAMKKKVNGWWATIGTWAIGPVPWDETWLSA